jgi:hypothetical protein
MPDRSEADNTVTTGRGGAEPIQLLSGPEQLPVHPSSDDLEWTVEDLAAVDAVEANERDAATRVAALEAEEKRRRDFERSLAGPSVGKAGEWVAAVAGNSAWGWDKVADVQGLCVIKLVRSA